MIHDTERDFSIFASKAQGTKASLPEIQQRSAEFRQLSAELRERRQQHSDAALNVLDGWQRQRLSRRAGTERRSDEAARN